MQIECLLLGRVAGRLLMVALLAMAPTALAEADSAQDPVAGPADLRVLTPSDALAYRRIFERQQDGDWAAADKLIAKLDDRVLMGHVLYQRYMHPTAYRSAYHELRDWLSAYGDHPDAWRVYRLAKRRQGRASGPSRPVPAEARPWIEADAADDGEARRSERSREAARSVNRFGWHMRRYLRIGRPDRAEKRFWAIDRLDLLTPTEAAGALSDIAYGYMHAGQDSKALALGRLAQRRALAAGSQGAWAAGSQGAWAAGLAAWRQQDCASAEPLFAHVADYHAQARMRAAGAVWAGRAALVCRGPERVSGYLVKALAAPESFYGVLARRQLGLPDPDLGDGDGLTAADLATVKAVTGGRRILALVDAGQHFRADADLRLMLKRYGHEHWQALGRLAAALELPAAQLYAGRHAGDEAPAGWRFPAPDWLAQDGFDLDRALVMAVVRQESAFKRRARSHAGASGLMQLMPSTAGMVARDRSLLWRRSRLYDPALNLRLGQAYLDFLQGMRRTEGNLFMTLAAYNGGPGNLARWKRETRFERDPLLYVETLPVSETRYYVKRVTANLWLYRMRYGQAAPSLDAPAANAWPLYQRLDPPDAVNVAGLNAKDAGIGAR